MSYKKGQWLAICDRCGFEFLSGQMKKTWDGLYVDSSCFETRHPQDFVKGVKESSIPYSRPEPSEDAESNPYDYFVSGYMENPIVNNVYTNYITLTGVEYP